jgi:RHS repeat-associated protein
VLVSQEQAGVKTSYNLDPAGRVLETVSGTKKTVNHYGAPGEGVAWTCEGTEPSGKCEGTEKWTRDILGFSGLVAIQAKGEAPVLELSDLHGDMIGTASISETESKLVSANETTEYGVPRTTITAKYSWLGADEVPTELSTGVINMGARTYVPQLGRFEQTDPQPGGSINPYAYTDDDPVNQADPTGENTITYNYEAAELGPAQEGLPEQYGAPGAIKPPPANHQAEAEFAAHPPWDAASVFDGESSELSGRLGDVRGFLTFPDDHSPNVQSECNEHGQDCPGCRSGGSRNKKGECEKGKDTGSNGSVEVCSALGGFVGGALGTAFGTPLVGAAAAAAGGEAGGKACGG